MPRRRQLLGENRFNPIQIDPANPQDNLNLLEALYRHQRNQKNVTLDQDEVFEIPLRIKGKVVKRFIRLTQTVTLGMKERNHIQIPTYYIFDKDAKKGQGKFGAGYQVSASQKESPYQPFKTKLPNQRKHSQFVKVIDLSDSKKINNEDVQNEFSLLQPHAKEVIFDNKNKRAYIIMHEFKGMQLNDYINHQNALLHNPAVDKKLEFKNRLQIAINLAKALQRIHEVGIIHCDIKSSNILVDPETLEVNIIDFGLSKKKGTSAKISGEIIFQPPEFFDEYNLGNDTDRDGTLQAEESDIFSLGYCMVEIFNAQNVRQADPASIEKTYSKPHQLFDFFKGLDLDRQIQNDIENNINFMMIEKRRRITLSTLIAGLEKQQLELAIKENPNHVNALRKAYKAAIKARGNLKQLENSNNQDLHENIRQIVISHLGKIDNTETVVKQFIQILGIKAFNGLKSTSEIIEKMNLILKEASANLEKYKIQSSFINAATVFLKDAEKKNLNLSPDYFKKIHELLFEAQILYIKIDKRKANLDGLNDINGLASNIERLNQEIAKQYDLVTIDPSNVPPEQLALIDALYQQHHDIHQIKALDSNQFYFVLVPDQNNPLQNKLAAVKLTKRVLLHTKKIGNEDHLNVKVLENKSLNNGSFAFVHETTKPSDRQKSSSITKVMILSEQSGITKEMVLDEAGLIPRTNRPKPIIIEREHAYIGLRKFKMDLYEFLKTHKAVLTVEQRLTLSLNLARELESVHQSGKIHRDIKPENIMIDPDTLEVILIDWGLSRKKEDHHKDNEIVGSRQYIAPEVATSPLLESSDVFSMACVLAEVWNGKNSRDAVNFNSVDFVSYVHENQINFNNLFYGMILHQQVQVNLAKAINTGIEKDPAKRITTTQFRQALEEAKLAHVISQHAALEKEIRDAHQAGIKFFETINSVPTDYLPDNVDYYLKHVLLETLNSLSSTTNQIVLDQFIDATRIKAFVGKNKKEIEDFIHDHVDKFKKDYIKISSKRLLIEAEIQKLDKLLKGSLPLGARHLNEALKKHYQSYLSELNYLFDKYKKRTVTFDEVVELNAIFDKKLPALEAKMLIEQEQLMKQVRSRVVVIEQSFVKNQFDPYLKKKQGELLLALDHLSEAGKNQDDTSIQLSNMVAALTNYETLVHEQKDLRPLSTSLTIELLNNALKTISVSSTNFASEKVLLQAKQEVLLAIEHYVKKYLTSSKAKHTERGHDIEDLILIIEKSNNVNDLYQRIDRKLSRIETGFFGRSHLRDEVRSATHFKERIKKHPK